MSDELREEDFDELLCADCKEIGCRCPKDWVYLEMVCHSCSRVITVLHPGCQTVDRCPLCEAEVKLDDQAD